MSPRVLPNLQAVLAQPTPARSSHGRRIPYVDLPAQYADEREAIHRLVEEVFLSGEFVGGACTDAFEAKIAEAVGVRYAVALSSGTDALILALQALDIGPGDEVICPPNSFIATAGAVVAVGARPVFADVGFDQNIDPAAVEAAISTRTRALLAVHLTGRVADMDAIGRIARRHGLAVVEDAAQAMGARFADRSAGALGTIGCFSAHPVKNLNAAGDAGFITTDDRRLAERVARLRRNGLVDRDTSLEWGRVARMDNLQAAILLMRLERLPEIVAKRRANAQRYRALIDPALAFNAPCRPQEYNCFHTYVVQLANRDRLRARLAERGIGTAVHYPIPIHLQPAARGLGYGAGAFPMAERQARSILSLPVHQYLSPLALLAVAETVNEEVLALQGEAD
ncbi:MAG: DegT/DnrJ/EryC1/StrS family aminotransferase [Alphaproteobacteria bacterium]|nr:DegT/DnrJ/EryC1/StrS family aminotransferase [Alphaproteobacteria bacterium]